MISNHFIILLFSDISLNFSRFSPNYPGFFLIFDFKNVNLFSIFFHKKSRFITTSQNLCSLFGYVNQRNPHFFLWTMWITRCITPIFHYFAPFFMWITLRIKCGELSILRHFLYIFYNREYSENKTLYGHPSGRSIQRFIFSSVQEIRLLLSPQADALSTHGRSLFQIYGQWPFCTLLQNRSPQIPVLCLRTRLREHGLPHVPEERSR